MRASGSETETGVSAVAGKDVDTGGSTVAMGGEQDDWMWVCVGWVVARLRGWERGECVVWFFFFCLVCDSSLMHVVCVCVLVVVDWLCLFFFFDVTLVSLFLIACLVCEVCLFVWIWYLTTCSVLLSCTWFCVSIVSSSLFLKISSSCVVEEEETEGAFRFRSKSARRLWHSGSVIVLVALVSFIAVM